MSQFAKAMQRMGNEARVREGDGPCVTPGCIYHITQTPKCLAIRVDLPDDKSFTADEHERIHWSASVLVATMLARPLFERQAELARKQDRTAAEEAELRDIGQRLLELPGAASPEDHRAMDLIRRAAERLEGAPR